MALSGSSWSEESRISICGQVLGEGIILNNVKWESRAGLYLQYDLSATRFRKVEHQRRKREIPRSQKRSLENGQMSVPRLDL